MMIKKFRFGFIALIVSGLLSGISYLPNTAFARGEGATASGFEMLTKQQIRSMPNNSLLQLRQQLTLFSTKRSLPPNVSAGARAKLPLVNAEIKRRGIGAAPARRPQSTSQDILAVLHNYQDPSRLNDRQLKQRLGKLERLIDARGVKKKWKRRAKSYRAADRAELQRRREARAPKPDNTKLLAVLKDRRPLSSLSKKQLKRRLVRLQAVINNPNVAQRHLNKASRLQQRTRVELKSRRTRTGDGSPRNEGDNPRYNNDERLVRVLNDRRRARDLSKAQLRQRLFRLQKVLDARAISPRWKAHARQMYSLDKAELKRRRYVNGQGDQGNNQPNDQRAQEAKVLRVLNDQRSSQQLALGQLRRRVARLDRIIDRNGIAPRHKSRARSMRRRDQVELDRRRRSNQANTNDNRVHNNSIARLMSDRRIARNLSDNQLRARVREIRQLMRRRDISPDLRSRLSRKLVGDRRELRRRVAAQNNPYDQGQGVNKGSRKVAAIAQRLLNDYRNARQLNKRQLRKRIRDAREVLLYAPLPRPQIAQIKQMIAADRAEKRARLFAARERRREKLSQLRRQGQLRFKVAPGMRMPQNRDISGAEANDRMIRRQFLAGDGRSNARKYSRQEVASRPELTRRFGGIDIDTIKFGFNEYWVREEEVDEIERMAITIERILAARPYEVFQIEGHTDAVGSDRYNLGLSRQRAKAVKDALTKYFLIPPRALVTVGLGEQYLKIPTQLAESENRRVTVRRITPLLRQ